MSIDPSIPPTPPPSTPAVPPPSFTSAPSPPPPSPAALEAKAASAEESPHTPPAEPAAESTAVAPAGENTVAMVCYLTLIGFIVALVINNGPKKNSLGQFHLRQMLGLIIVSFVLYVVFTIAGVIAGKIASALGTLVFMLLMVVYLALFGAWLIGFLGALKGEKKAIPVIGDIFQDKLKGVFPD